MAKIADVQEVSLGLLRPYEKNAKIHGRNQIEKLKDSISAFGFLNPCLIDGDLNIIAGHGRVMAAKELGWETVPCVFIEGLTEAERRAYILADNRLAELASWDMDIVNEELTDLDDMDFNIELTGFELETDVPEVHEDEGFDETRAEPRAKRGDIYQLGDHRLMCGDATSSEDVEQLMNGDRADLSITSPPYGASKSAKIRTHYQRGESGPDSFYIDHDDDIDSWAELISGAFSNMQTASECQYVNIQMLADNKRLLIDFLYDHRDELVDIIIWDKKKAPPQMQKNVLNNQFEFVFVFGKANSSRAIPFGNFHGTVNNVVELTTGANEFSDIHKAVFPVGFPSALMQISSSAKSVLDLFGGTGTTMIAAEQVGLRCYMMELDPHYCDVIIERWENLTGKKGVLLNG